MIAKPHDFHRMRHIGKVVGLAWGCLGLVQVHADEAKAGNAPKPSLPFLERLESPVYETEGDHQSITKRAIICINQTIKPGFTATPTILSSDLESGTIVANNQFVYAFGFGNMMVYTARTILTF